MNDVVNLPTARKQRTRLGFTIPKAAKELGIGESLLRRAIKAGDVKVVPFGGRILLTRVEIERVRAVIEGLKE
jgi:Helix-turn-helix domain